MNIFADFKKLFKGPWLFKQQKKFLSGSGRHRIERLNNCLRSEPPNFSLLSTLTLTQLQRLFEQKSGIFDLNSFLYNVRFSKDSFSLSKMKFKVSGSNAYCNTVAIPECKYMEKKVLTLDLCVTTLLQRSVQFIYLYC